MRRLVVPLAALVAATVMVLSQVGFAANHREAPITALDHKADITDVYAFTAAETARSIFPVQQRSPATADARRPRAPTHA